MTSHTTIDYCYSPAALVVQHVVTHVEGRARARTLEGLVGLVVIVGLVRALEGLVVGRV